MEHYKIYSDYLEHHGILGQKWGVRRFQNKDGSLTSEGKERYYGDNSHNDKYSDVNESSKQLSGTKMGQVFDRFEHLKYDEYKKYMIKQLEAEYDDEDDSVKELYKSKEDYVSNHSLDSGEDGLARKLWIRDQFKSDEEYNLAKKEYIDYAEKFFEKMESSLPKSNPLLKKLGMAKSKDEVYNNLWLNGKVPGYGDIMDNLDRLGVSNAEFERITRGFKI